MATRALARRGGHPFRRGTRVTVSLLLMVIDRDLADQLAEAVNRQRQVAEFQPGRVCHPLLAPLEELLDRVASGDVDPLEMLPSALEGSRAPTPRNGATVGTVKPEWLTSDECAAITGLGRSTVRRHIATGSLPSSKIGRSRRIHRDQLAAFMDGRAV